MIRGRRFWQDAQFWLAAAAAPVCWQLLVQAGVPVRHTAIPILPLLLAIVASPILEEIVFRGGLQEWLLRRESMRQKRFGISLANLLVSLVFAASHLLHHPPLWAVLTIVPSLVFGWAWERHQTLFSPIGLHMLYNAGFVWLFG